MPGVPYPRTKKENGVFAAPADGTAAGRMAPETKFK
jgi:hypothetical protein